jgi:hypothetical protein
MFAGADVSSRPHFTLPETIVLGGKREQGQEFALDPGKFVRSHE